VIGLIPNTNVGWAALVIGVLGVLFVAARCALARAIGRSLRRTSMAVLTGFLVVCSGARVRDPGSTPRTRPGDRAIAGAVVRLVEHRVTILGTGGCRGSGVTSSSPIVMGERNDRAIVTRQLLARSCGDVVGIEERAGDRCGSEAEERVQRLVALNSPE